MLKNRKGVAWIVASFLLLSAISLYRQISMHFIPDDPVRPVVVYFVYLLLLALWWGSIRNRIVQSNMRIFLLLEHMCMLVAMTTRFLQDAFLQTALLSGATPLMRASGYFVVISTILTSLFGLYASFGLGKAEEYRINRNWYFLLIPAGILILFLLTNESHHLIFLLSGDDTQSNLYYHPNMGIFVIIAWAISLVVVRIFLIYRRSRDIQGSSLLKSAPFLIAVFMLLFNVPYIYYSFVVEYEFVEYFAFIFFLEAIIWESCIIAGMVPVNTHYEEVFDRSTVAMQIVKEDGTSYLKSAEAPELSAELFELLKKQTTVRTPEGQELHMHVIHGGHSIWQSDISQTIAAIDELQKSAEKLEHEGDLLRQELKARSDETRVKEQNYIYNQLTDEIEEQLLLLHNLLEERESVADKAALFKKICLVGTYIKRRCNLRLIEQSEKRISNEELKLCYHELADCLQQLKVETDIRWNATNELAPEFAIFTLDVFECLLEYEHFELHSIKMYFETDTVFSIRMYSDNGSTRQIPDEELHRVNKENYGLRWQVYENGYQLSVCSGMD